MNGANKNKINEVHQKIMDQYVPLKKIIFEDNKKEVDIIQNFTEYSNVLANVELMIHSFVTANPDTTDKEILYNLRRVRKDPLHEFSHLDEDALAFAITYGMSRGLQQKRLFINEINALLDWLIHEVDGRMQKNESYIEWLRTFFKDNSVKSFKSN